ncbi:hypothetical protein GCM10022252_60950 [Streptosporangium oxazolinicum]|uniref:NADP-dependent oxidoreductase domain-containing protein n=1 Tax=Streptosporangium oxazolinicum TaxID=909287 RepID=A0ABP8BCH1_9ACTN
MRTRELGNLKVPAIGFGAMVLSPGVYGDVDDARAETALRTALDAGAYHVDTSDAYGSDGHNERLVGRAIRGRRDEVVIATKFGLAIPEGSPAAAHPPTSGRTWKPPTSRCTRTHSLTWNGHSACSRPRAGRCSDGDRGVPGPAGPSWPPCVSRLRPGPGPPLSTGGNGVLPAGGNGGPSGR